MSYQKLYDRQFLKLSEEKIIPIILDGSSNCTMFYGGREIYERNWHPMFNISSNLFNVNTSIIRDKIKSMAEQGDLDSEWYKDTKTGKWITNSDILKWFDNGVKSAKTIEEIRKAIPGQGLACSIVLSEKDQLCSYREVNYKYCISTEEILSWIEELNSYIVPEHYTLFYIKMGYSGIEPLNLGKTINENIRLICKSEGRYIKEFTNNSITYSRNKADSYIFENKKDFEDNFLPILNRFGNRYTLVNAEILNKKEMPKNYYIKSIEGSYKGWFVEKKTSAGLYFTTRAPYAKKFESEKLAKKYIEEKLSGFTKNVLSVVKIGED